MKFPTWFALTALAVGGLFAAVPERASAQSVPDILWRTNAHGGKIWSVAFSVDGAMLASGSEDRTARVWSVPAGELLTTVSTPHAWVISVAIQSLDNLLLTGGDDGTVRVWSLVTGSFLYGTSPNEDIAWSITVSSNGGIAIGRSNSGIDLLVPQGSFPLEGHSRDVYSLAFSRDTQRLASASADGTARIWRTSDGAQLQVLTGHSILSTNEDDTVINPVWGVDISPDGTLLATSGGDGTVRLWQMAGGGQVRVIPSPGASTVRFSPDGRLLFTLNGGEINIWIVRTGQLLASYASVGASALAVSPTKTFFAYGRGDGALFLARFPLWIDSITQDSGRVVLHWQGGSGRYQVQARRHMNQGRWHNLGASTRKTTFSHPAASHFFYRVLSLPNQ